MKPFVQDVFNIDDYTSRGINKIFLISGVSSGKSTWVKDVLTQKGSVLFVTSRKAKAESDIKYSSFTDVINWYTEENQTLLTNAGLATRIENLCVNDTIALDEFVQHFDYVVIDEVHSIASDALFASSAYTVLSFVEYVANIGKTIICMTGTPAPVYDYFKDNDWLILDYLNVCNYVHPSMVLVIRKHNVINLIKTHSDSKIVYFANRTDSMRKICRELLLAGVFNPSEISISVSKSKEKETFDALKKELNKAFENDDAFYEIEKASANTYENIIDNHLLPDSCKILLSTSTLKEGVDIDNENILMFCENHVLSNLIQFFGRARKSNTKVYVVENSTDHPIDRSNMLYSYAVKEELAAANDFLLETFNATDNPLEVVEKHKLIKHVVKNPYIYYDYLKNNFSIFHLKYNEEVRLSNNHNWKGELEKHCNKYRIAYYDFTNKSFWEEALIQMAKSKRKYFGKENTICSALCIVYDIDNRQPKKINKALEDQNASIRVLSGVETKGENRDKTYWQIVFKEDFK